MTQDTQMTGELLPCPFCGGEAELDTAQAYRALSGGRIGDRATVYCLKCSADMGFCYEDAPGAPREDIVNQVVDDWNRRAALEPAPAPARELVESRRLTSEDVGWVVNDIAELGVKIGDQFFFLYKGKSLVYGELDPDPSIPPVHEDGSPMHWRHVFKREFGECAHPINYGDLTKIGTVSLDDSDEWQPLPAALAKQGGQ